MRLDRLYSVDWEVVRTVTFQWIDRIQDGIGKFGKERLEGEMVAATAINFLLVCERFKVEPRRALEVADRIIRDALDTRPGTIRAIKAYLREQIKHA